MLLLGCPKLQRRAADAATVPPACWLQVWVVAELKDGRLYWQADSDSQLTKVGGLLAG